MAEVAGQVEMPGGPLERLVSDTHGPVGVTDHMIDVGTNGPRRSAATHALSTPSASVGRVVGSVPNESGAKHAQSVESIQMKR